MVLPFLKYKVVGVGVKMTGYAAQSRIEGMATGDVYFCY
jgi:hypothetical protein